MKIALRGGNIDEIIELSRNLLGKVRFDDEIFAILEDVKKNINLTITSKTLDDIDFQKNISRRGWVVRGIGNPENNLQHSLSLISICRYFKPILVDAGFDFDKMILMCLIHDIAENDENVGDIIPSDGISESVKQEMESKSAKRIFDDPDGDGILYRLWQDYSFKKTKEAIFLKELDKIDPLIKCMIYESEHGMPLFMEFYNHMIAKDQIKDPFLIGLRAKLLERYMLQKNN